MMFYEKIPALSAALHTGGCLQSLYISQEINHKRMEERQNVTYILRCSDGTLYTGWTNNLEKRLREHNAGQGAKYTRGRTPVTLVYAEQHDTKQEAMKREVQIKRLTRQEKEELVSSYKKGIPEGTPDEKS